MGFLKRMVSMLSIAAICVQMLGSGVAAAQEPTGTRLEIITDMVHNNPGQKPYVSAYNDPAFLTQRGLTGKVFFLYDAAQFGIDWQSYDPDIIPVGSVEYEWVQAKKASLTEKYNAAKAAGQKVYFMMDMIVFPNGIKTLYGDEILTDGKIDIDRPKTQELIASMFQQMFEQYPQIDGIYIRTGETYVGSGYGTEPDNSAPYYFGNNPVNGVVDKHLTLLRLLRENVCEKGKDVVYRTWGFDDFQKTKEGYLAVADKVEPHEHLYFAIKHTSGDFWRNRDFNQAIGAGSHKQIVEVQCAREYEGKGAFPNYIAGGVIDGFEEYAWQMDADQNQGLRDVVGTEDSVVKGVWTWSRGGGWDGPYINGTENPEGEELWADVNAYVVQSWAQDTSATDEELVLRYARTVLGMDEADARSFYQICKKSSYAVLLGIGIDHDASWEAMWTRDDTVIAKTFQNNVNRIYNAGRQDGTYTKLDELERSVALWQEMLALAVTYTFREAAADVGLLQVGINRSYSNTVYYDNLQVYRQEEREVTARDVAQAVVSCPTVANTDETLPLPGVPAGFTIALKSSSSDAVALDGQLNRQEEAQQVLLEFTVTKTADGTTADTAKLPVSIPGTYWLELPAAYGILPGQTIQLYPSVSPYTADDLLYESSDSTVAAVQAAGAVTGVEEGVARITVSTRDRRLQTAVMIYVGEENPVFEEDFASYRDGQRLEWERNIEEPRSTITVVSLERNQVLKLYQPVIGGSTSAYHIKTFAPQTGKVSVSVEMMLESLNSAYFFLCDSTGKIIGQVYCMDSGIYMDVGGRLVRIYEGTYHAGQWYHFTFHCDTEAAAYTVQVDEQAPVSLSFREPASNVGMIMLGINRTAENTVYFDNIKVTSQEKTDATAAEVAGTINEAPAIRSGDTRLTMPAVPKGFSIRLKSSTSQAVALDGTLTMGEEPQTAALVFTLTRLSDQSQADTAPVTVTVPALQSRPFIVQVQTPAEITVPCGTPFAELPLPDTLSVTWSDGASSRLAVTWSADGYRPEQEESYILSGVLKASDEENPNGLSAKIRVTVSGTDESQTLAQARAAAMSVLAAFKPSNDTTAEEILDAVKAVVVNERIIIRWDDPFTLAPADATQNGSITGSLTLTLNGESQTVDVDLVIPVILIKGDVTGDGRVSIEDVMAACRILARKNTGSLPNDDEIARADLTGDDKVAIEDIMAICRVLASNA